jgi:alkanesulfonate monooxygenase SsuD/methylene tetrahydromethanopterin reductase-like flavin-dependent oxidoreductase (luciferase family)
LTSDGRLILGLGSGLFEEELRTFGYPWEQRVSRFEEALKIISTLLREGQIDFEGQYYTMRNAELRPRGPRTHGPPIMIGALASGPRMLRLTAQYADFWNVHPWGPGSVRRPEQIAPLRDAVDEACRKVQRDPATLLRTVTVDVDLTGRASPGADQPIVGSPVEIAETLRAFSREGISHIQVGLTPRTLAGLEAFAPVLEALDRG